MESVEDALQVLDLSAGASAAEVQEAYRTMVKVWHPDRFPNDAKMHKMASEKTKDVNRAFEFLQRHGTSPARAASPASVSDGAGISPAPKRERTPRSTDVAASPAARHWKDLPFWEKAFTAPAATCYLVGLFYLFWRIFVGPYYDSGEDVTPVIIGSFAIATLFSVAIIIARKRGI